MRNKRKSSLRRNKISIPSTIILILIMLVIMFPFYIMIVGTFKPAVSLVTIPIDLNPFTNLTLKNLQKVLLKSDVFLWLKNSFLISFAVCFLTCFVAVTAGYSFARIEFKGKKVCFMFVMATLMMPKQVLLIPNYLVANSLGLVDTMIGVVLTSVVPASGVFLCRQFILSIPKELYEAAEIDGCGEIKKFSQITLPLSLPAIGSTAIFAFFGAFNDYLWQLVMISKKSLKTLPIGVTLFAQAQQGNRAVQLAVAFVATIPLAVLFIVFQKFFIKGSTEGSVKG